MLNVATSSSLTLSGTPFNLVTYPKPWNLVLSKTCFLTSRGLNSLRHFRAPRSWELAALTCPAFARRNFWRMRRVWKGAGCPLFWRIHVSRVLVMYTDGSGIEGDSLYSAVGADSSMPYISLYPASLMMSPSLAENLKRTWPSGRLSQSEPDLSTAAFTLALSSATLTPVG